jgi:hypothetical protein
VRIEYVFLVVEKVAIKQRFKQAGDFSEQSAENDLSNAPGSVV